MKPFNKLIFFSFTLFISTRAFSQSPAQQIPDFNLSRLDKTNFSRTDLPKDKFLFFMFFDSDCEHCQHAAHNLSDHRKDYKDAAIVLVSVDDQQKINYFLKTFAPDLSKEENVIVLQDLHNEFLAKFKPRRYPSMFLYSKDQKLIGYEDNEESMFRFINVMRKK